MIYHGNNKIKKVYFGNIPIKEAYYGSTLVWKKSDGDDDVVTKGFVDLGLPSGLLWAIYNIGSDSPRKVGNHYHWGDTEEHIAMSDIQGTEYDIATKEWGETHWGTMWMMPNLAQWSELIESCDWEYIDPIVPEGSEVVRIAKGTSKYNQAIIQFPYRRILGNDGYYYEGKYWTANSTPDVNLPYYTRFYNMHIYQNVIHNPATMGILINYVRAVAQP